MIKKKSRTEDSSEIQTDQNPNPGIATFPSCDVRQVASIL
jgi:hypothetical protein